jgi:hypothetical protein
MASAAAERPNIVFILADDLGWGDPPCYNPESKIPMPHLGRLLADCKNWATSSPYLTQIARRVPSRRAWIVLRLTFTASPHKMTDLVRVC